MSNWDIDRTQNFMSCRVPYSSSGVYLNLASPRGMDTEIGSQKDVLLCYTSLQCVFLSKYKDIRVAYRTQFWAEK